MPRDAELKIREWFPAGNEAEAIIANWSFYSELWFSRSSIAQVKREARAVLQMSVTNPIAHPDFVKVRGG